MPPPRLQQWARDLKRHTLTVYFAARDPRTPWAVRLLALLIAAYALSPIDLIPDFIPILGYLDDLILVPLGIAVAIRLIPKDVYAECRKTAEQESGQRRPANWIAGGIIIGIWIALAALALRLIVRLIKGT